MDRDFARRPGRSNDYRLSRQERGTCHADYQDRLIEWKRTQAQRRELRHHNMKPRMISGTQINAMIRAILLRGGTANKTQFANTKAMGTHRQRAGSEMRRPFNLGSDDREAPVMRA